MQREIAKRIVVNTFGTLSLHENYSGRGMYGKTTTGIVGSLSDFLESISNLFVDYSAEMMDEEDEQMKELIMNNVHDLADAVRELQTDNMGMDTIFY